MFFYPKIRQLLALNRAKEAIELIRLELSKSPEDDELFLLLAEANIDLNRPKAAAEAARQAIALEPDNDSAFLLLAVSLLLQNKYREVHQTIDQGLALNSENVELYGLRARAFCEKNKAQKGLEAAEQGLAIDPDEELCRFYRSLALSELGRHEEAEEQTLDLLSDDANDSHNHSINGWIRLQAGDVDAAERAFLEALRINADNSDARTGLAQALKRRNPLVSWLLRSLQWISRINWVVFVVAMIALGRLNSVLINSEGSFALVCVGLFLKVSVSCLFVCWILSSQLGALAISLTKTGRLALPSREKLALKWTALPFLLALVFLVYSLFSNARLFPAGGYAWAAATALLFCAISHELSWVRLRLYAVSTVVILIAIWVSSIAPFLLAEKAREAVAALKNADREAFKAAFQSFSQFKKKGVLYPAFVAWIIGAFHQELASWLESRAPDEEFD